MTLEDWARSSWLVEHRTSPEEIRELLGLADRDLKDCRVKGLSDDWRLSIAYNAALQCAMAALAACGYRPSREAHHFRVIQSLAFTLGLDASLVSRLDAYRKKRNLTDYERAGVVSTAEANDMAKLARDLHRGLKEWLNTEHPELMAK